MSIKTFMYEKFTDLSNILSNPLSTSKFLEEGVLTPEEFVQAGDLLVLKTPSWSWQPGNAKLGLQKGLPKEKHYLITRNVQCSMRVSALEAKCNNTETIDVETEDGEGGWVQTHTNGITNFFVILTISKEVNTNDDEIPEIVTDQKKSDEDSDDEDAPEIDLSSLSFKEDIKDDDEATLSSQNVVKTRTYDISICYDQYHQTPRVWLFGYDESKQPLKPEQVLQDISQDHVNKTVTIAAHPHTGVPQAYIHPCRHAAVMKKVVQRMIESGKVPRIDQYLFLFLKFIHAAIPTIEYDYTFQMDLQ